MPTILSQVDTTVLRVRCGPPPLVLLAITAGLELSKPHLIRELMLTSARRAITVKRGRPSLHPVQRVPTAMLLG